MAVPLLKLGTRGSKLALIQAGLVRDALAAAVPALAAPDAIEIVPIKTTGDVIQDRPLSEAGGGQGVLDQPVDALEMGARGDFRHHAAETAMLGQLAIDQVGQNPAARRAAGGWRLDDGHGRFVAARFNSHHTHACLLASAAHLR